MINNDFDYLEYVLIKPLDNLPGRVVEISVKKEIVYKVEYWLDSTQKSVWVYQDELNKVKS